MKLTKEECVGALEVFLNISEEECVNGDYFEEYTKDSRETLQRLINEHFDNPPLKFEELEEGMWVWENLNKRYDKIIEINKERRTVETTLAFYLYYENENTFYRREVKEDE